MAVDTRQKRFNIMAVRNGLQMSAFPMFEADGAVDADDRAHLLARYGGNAWSSPAGVTGQLLQLPRFMRGGSNPMHGGFSA